MFDVFGEGGGQQQINCGGVKNNVFNNGLQHKGKSTSWNSNKSFKSWMILDHLGISVNPNTSGEMNKFESSKS